MNIKGTVLEINSDTALVMTSDCDFLEINRREGLAAGQEIVFSRRDIVKKSKPFDRRIITYALVACLALLFICIPVYTSFFTGAAGAAVAYVSIDMNSSLELTVNDKSRVLVAEALDQDGEKLLQTVSVQGKPVTEAIKDLIGAAEEMKYISNEDEDLVLVCLSPADMEKQNPKSVVNIGDKLADYEKSNTKKVKVVGATKTQYQEAKQMGMSAGRYALWEDITKSDQSKLEQYKTDKPSNFLGEARSNDNVKDNGITMSNGNGAWNWNSKNNKNGSWSGNANDKDKDNENKNNNGGKNNNSSKSNNGNSNINLNWNGNVNLNSNISGYSSGFNSNSGNNGGVWDWNASGKVKENKNKNSHRKDNDANNSSNKNWNSNSISNGIWNNSWSQNNSNRNGNGAAENLGSTKSSRQNNSKTPSLNFQKQNPEIEKKFNKNRSNTDFMNKDKNTNKNTDHNEGNAKRR